jgi:putative RNA 2'-phosphotransferase
MDESRRRRLSKFLSQHLRHAPAARGITLDAAGWTEIDALLAACRARGVGLDRATLEALVATSDKQRFAIDPAGRRIRANQGHSVPVDLGLPALPPPPVLYHGTPARLVATLLGEGLRPMGRHAVHLSAAVDTAVAVGARRGRPAVLAVDAAGMAAAGHRFTRSANGVWLVAAVPPEFLSRASPGNTPADPGDPPAG